MTAGDMGPLDLASPVSHVAASLDRAAPAALSYEELATGYVHPNPSDLSRIRNHQGLSTDAEAISWLIRVAVDELRHVGKTTKSTRQLSGDNGTVAFAEGIGSIDDLKWNGHKVYAVQDIHKVLGDPFNPMSGELAGNVRKNTGKDPELDALRASMREAGWLPGHPAVMDERGVVISGHRRLSVAEELGITPDILKVNFAAKHGAGDPADLRRMDVALLSNYGFKKLTPEERAEIAAYLKETRGLSQAEIAAGLGVSQPTIHRDLIQMNNDHGREPKPDRLADSPELRADVGEYVESGQPIPMKELQAKHGVGKNTITRAAEYERGRRDAVDEWLTKFDDLVKTSDRGRLLQMKQSIDRALAALGEF